MKKPKKIDDWGKEFDKDFFEIEAGEAEDGSDQCLVVSKDGLHRYSLAEIKQFIKHLLKQKEEELLKEIEKEIDKTKEIATNFTVDIKNNYKIKDWMVESNQIKKILRNLKNSKQILKKVKGRK